MRRRWRPRWWRRIHTGLRRRSPVRRSSGSRQRSSPCYSAITLRRPAAATVNTLLFLSVRYSSLRATAIFVPISSSVFVSYAARKSHLGLCKVNALRKRPAFCLTFSVSFYNYCQLVNNNTDKNNNDSYRVYSFLREENVSLLLTAYCTRQATGQAAASLAAVF